MSNNKGSKMFAILDVYIKKSPASFQKRGFGLRLVLSISYQLISHRLFFSQTTPRPAAVPYSPGQAWQYLPGAGSGSW